MGMPKYPDISDNRSARLAEIARVLGIPVERFFAAPPDEAGGDVLTLLWLWSAIEDGQARRRVINLARQEAQRSGHPERA